MEIKLVEKPAFSVIGRQGRGPSGLSSDWIPPLWKELTRHFSKIAGLVKLDEGGKPAAVWGAMSDVNLGFRRWDSEGLYLAGFEVTEGSLAPVGFVRWDIPGFKYLAVGCSTNPDASGDTYGEVFYHVLNEYMPAKGFTLAGAVHELYSSPARPGELRLYFPIERL